MGVIAGIGMTVALFVAGEAFGDPVVQGTAKMWALSAPFARRWPWGWGG